MVIATVSRPLTAVALRLTATPVVAGPTDDLVTHVRATLDAQLRALLTHQQDAGDPAEPEAVHQMRVAGRRIRVALRIGRPALGPAGESLRAEVAWLGGILGPVRDLDVLCERLRDRAADLPDVDRDGFDQVMAALDEARVADREQLVSALGGKRYRAVLRSLAALASPPEGAAHRTADGTGLPANAVELVRPPVSKLRKEVRRAGKHPAAEKLHELRIRGKRVRYAAEFGVALADRRVGKRLRELAKAARNFQDVLGAHQDTVAAEERLRQLGAESGDRLSPAALLVLGRLVEREYAERNGHRANWRPAWQALDQAAGPLLN